MVYHLQLLLYRVVKTHRLLAPVCTLSLMSDADPAGFFTLLWMSNSYSTLQDI
jgi:hypothetical protein